MSADHVVGQLRHILHLLLTNFTEPHFLDILLSSSSSCLGCLCDLLLGLGFGLGLLLETLFLCLDLNIGSRSLASTKRNFTEPVLSKDLVDELVFDSNVTQHGLLVRERLLAFVAPCLRDVVRELEPLELFVEVFAVVKCQRSVAIEMLLTYLTIILGLSNVSRLLLDVPDQVG